MGAFFFIAAVALPYLRRFDRRGLLLSAAASLLALYTKPYFVLGFGIVASYTFLFISKKAGLIYALGFGAVTAVSVFLIRSILPLYFYDTIFNNLSQAAQNNPAHMLRQLRQLAVEFLPLVVAGLLVLLAALAALTRGAAGGVRLIDRRDLFGPASPGVRRAARLLWLRGVVHIAGVHADPRPAPRELHELCLPAGGADVCALAAGQPAAPAPADAGGDPVAPDESGTFLPDAAAPEPAPAVSAERRGLEVAVRLR